MEKSFNRIYGKPPLILARFTMLNSEGSEEDIYINPYQVTSVMKRGSYTVVSTSDGKSFYIRLPRFLVIKILQDVSLYCKIKVVAN